MIGHARSPMLNLQRLDAGRRDWERMDAFPDRVIFQTREWLEFVARAQRAEPVVAAVMDGSELAGYFTGLIVRRYGVSILGSPFPGWTTASMGFNLVEGVSRRAATEALVAFAFGPAGCAHLELKDRRLVPEDLAGLGFRHSPTLTFEIDLEPDEETIFARMSSACRRAIRKGERVGVKVEEATPDGFADEYHAQLLEVFARQGLRPTYGVDRVRELIRCLHPTGRLLLLRAIAPGGERIATGIFPAMNGTAYFWGGASWRSHQILRPNEAIFWHAMRYWRARGMKVLDMGGGGDYKRRYGPRELIVPAFRRSRLAAVGLLRDLAARTAARRLTPRRSLFAAGERTEPHPEE
jgi:CelD/BcsL family acetyltransferase involved in cellulose biosynthesis